jgi:RNA polymerase sigma-70 factor (ECF subfamily)
MWRNIRFPGNTRESVLPSPLSLARPPPSPAPEGDASALRRAIERAVARVCPRWLAHQREDLVQTSMTRLLQILQRGEANGTPGPSYLHRAAYTVTLDEIRKVQARREVSLEDEESSEPALPRTEDPERRALGREIGTGITGCLSGMLEDRRNAVTLYLQDHTVPEIATLLGWNVKRAHNLVYRGLDDLRRCLEAKGLKP